MSSLSHFLRMFLYYYHTHIHICTPCAGIHEMSGVGYENIDTPFSLIDATIFAQLVDLKDRLGPSSDVLHNRSYQQLWSDSRKCVDR